MPAVAVTVQPSTQLAPVTQHHAPMHESVKKASLKKPPKGKDPLANGTFSFHQPQSLPCTTIEGGVTCPYCSKAFPSLGELQAHLQVGRYHQYYHSRC
jgi:hypothetical protein